ncbi:MULTISPECIES: DUF63 family protein [Halobacteriales]|jgi:uncharacterized membrane protein|uniref:DUF63 family protein n=1 Tax=Halobacteriales TaxID=2235 RepID=UPI000679615A|nr:MULTISPECIES: DUF63 family protein [Halobacteria]MDT3436854.1 DUF63 family protein [Haloarcula sp. 1CSR25-25]
MSSYFSKQTVEALPETGSKEWWLLYLLAPIVLGAISMLVFPALVYDRFIWQYLWGPVVADAAGRPVVHDGVRAVTGYNIVNTATYLAAVGYSFPGLRAYLRYLNVTFDARLAYGFAPIIIAGGAMRALEDIGLLGDYAVLFITPTIYLVVTAITILALGVGALARNRGFLSIPGTVGVVGAIWAVGAVGWAFLYGATTAAPLRLWVPVATTGIALGVTALYYWGVRFVDVAHLRHPMLLLAVFGQLWDAAQNLIGVTFLGYSPKMFLTNLIYQATGFPGSTFVLKFLVTGGIVWYLADAKPEMNRTWWWLMTFFIGAIGLPMGVRGSLRMMLGV